VLSTTFLITAGLMTTATAPAQVNPVVPPEYTNMWGGNNGSGVGFGTSTNRVQALYIAPVNPNTVLFGVGFRRTVGTSASSAFSVNMTVSFSSTTRTLSTLSSTFATNVGTDATVIFNGVLKVPAMPANVSAASFVTIPASKPWLYKGPNLLVEAQTGTYVTGTGVRMDRCFERSTAGQAMSFGQGCGSATIGSTGAYMPGNSFSITLSGAPARQPVLPIIGLNSGTGIPMDLTPIGMTGCQMLTNMDLPQPFMITDASGAASMGPYQVPNVPGIGGLGVAFQWLYADPSAGNPLKALATGGRLVHLGPIICKNRYVYSFTSATNPTGTVQAGGPIALIKTKP
jgi:hypothetical protein